MLRGIFNFFLVWLIFISSLGFAVYQLQKPGFLVDQARSVRLYERIAAQVGNLTTKEGQGEAKAIFTATETKEVLIEAIDADTFYKELDKALAAYTNYLTGRDEQLGYRLELVTVKDNLTRAITEKMLAKYDALPTCKSNELKSWQAVEGLPTCQLPTGNVLDNDAERLFRAQAIETTDGLPDQLDAKRTPKLEEIRTNLTRGLQIMKLIWLGTAIFIGLYLLIFRSRGFFSLAGILIVAGLLEIGFSLIGWEWLRRNVADLLANSEDNAALFVDLAAALVEVLKTIMGNLSIITISAGGLCLLLGFFFRFRRAKEEPSR